MPRRQRTRRARWAVAAIAALTMLGGGVYVALPASAGVSIVDGFEGAPYDRWSAESRPGFNYSELVNDATARTGVNTAYLEAYPPTNTFARIYRTVTLSGSHGAERCFAEAYMWRVRLAVFHPNRTVTDLRDEMPRATLSILQGGINGPLVDGAFYDIPPLQQDWQRAMFAEFPRVNGDYTIEIKVASGGVTFDDVSITCNPVIR